LRKILEECPTCRSKLIITRLECSRCNTKIEGGYKPCRFCGLSDESLEFIELFVKNRGNIKEMERELSISYPTVRSRLMSVVEELGYKTETVQEEEQMAEKRMEILEEVERGEISVDEASEKIARFNLKP
jgi:hypothetical protein